MSESHDDLDACWNDYAVAIAPPPDAAARIRARVQRAVAQRDRVVDTADEPAPQPVTRAAAAVLWMKSSALSVGIAVAALGGLHVAARVRSTTPPPAELPAIVAAPEPTSQRLDVPPPPPVAAIPAAPAPSTAPPPVEPIERPAIARPRASAPAPASSTDTLAEETALLSRAKSAMDRRAYRDALVLLDEHARRFPSGMLAPERDAHRSIARCRSGERDSTIFATFTAAHPRSAYLSRVREACGDSSTDSPTPSE
jgi:hypothetical protein